VHSRAQRPAPSQQDRAAERLPESSWWLDSSGAVFAGAEAMNAALSTAVGTSLSLLIYRVPGIGAIQKMIYRWVAAHRYRFRGVTPLCESAPKQCVAPKHPDTTPPYLCGVMRR
jgi:predicted DCC family thiol-disulfide oxidoreductase YuxK